VRSLFDHVVRDRLRVRIDHLTPVTRPRWGTMNAQRALCHLADALRIMFGEHSAGPLQGPAFLRSGVVRWVVIASPLPWPKGLKTGEAFMVTPAEPGAFERDRVAVHDLIARCTGPEATPRWGIHPVFGDLSGC